MLPAKIENAVYGLVVTPVLYVADKYGMFTPLIAEGPLGATALAERIGADPDTVERLMLVLVSGDLVRRTADGRYSVDPAAIPYVDPTHASYVGGFVKHLVDGAPDRLDRIEQYLRDGKDAVDAEAPYAHFYRDDAATQDFMDAMWSLSYGVSRELAGMADLEGHKVLVDVGGANGPFAVAALERAPDLRAIVFDLPKIRPYLDRSRDEHGLAGRLDFVGGDFFRDEFPEGDVIAMGYVLSNWPDDQCVELLRKAHRACPPGGRLLVMDRLFDDGKTGPVSTAVMNLTMQLETHGVHRTVGEFEELFASAGFDLWEVRRSSGDKHLIVGRKRAA